MLSSGASVSYFDKELSQQTVHSWWWASFWALFAVFVCFCFCTWWSCVAVPCDTLAEDQHTTEEDEFKKPSLPFLPFPRFLPQTSISLLSINLSPTCLLAPTRAHTHTYAEKSSSTLPKLHCMWVQSHYCACVISTRRELFQIAHCCFPCNGKNDVFFEMLFFTNLPIFTITCFLNPNYGWQTK